MLNSYMQANENSLLVNGHGLAVTFPWGILGPTKFPLSVPPAIIVYVTPHSTPLTVTIAIPLIAAAVPEI